MVPVPGGKALLIGYATISEGVLTECEKIMFTKLKEAFGIDQQIRETDQESVPEFQRTLVQLSQIPGLSIKSKGIRIQGPTDSPSFIITPDRIRAIHQLFSDIKKDKDKTQHIVNILNSVMEEGV